MIKGLYFKLNLENPRDAYIYRFFTMQPDTENIDKIALLDKMIHLYLKMKFSSLSYGKSVGGNEK